MSSGSVDLDIILKYVSDKPSVKKAIDEIKTTYTKSFEKQGFYNDPIKRKMMAEKEAIKDMSSKIKDIVHSYEKLNRQGQLSHLFDIGKFTRKRKDQIRLNREQFEAFITEKIPEELKEEEKKKRAETRANKKKAKEEKKALDDNNKKERQNQEELAKNIAFERKLNIKRNIQHSKALDDNKKKEDELRKKRWMLLLGKWGRFGVGGLIVGQALKYISRAIGYAYATSMQGLDWQRTISGGASGGSWFGQGLAAYQRAGIGANQYQGFKRGIQGYLGSVKLGMGNAAPLMYLGLNALGNPDELERQLEKSLRRLPKDVSLALAGQMGLDYNMWEAIYSGRLDRERSSYSKEAIKEWSDLARSLNDLVTSIRTFFFNNLAPIAEGTSKFINFINRGSSLETTMASANLATTSFFPTPAGLGGLMAQLVKFGAVEVIVKNQNGEVIDRQETDAIMELG